MRHAALFQITYATTGPSDWIANGNNIFSSKSDHIVNSYLLQLTLSAYRQALNDVVIENNLPYIHFDSSVNLNYSRANSKDVSDKGPIAFDKQFNVLKTSEGFGGDFAYDYLGGNKIVGNTLFGKYRGRGSNKRNTFFDGVYNGYYKVEFFGPNGRKQTVGQLLFRKESDYKNFINHYQNIYNHFKVQIQNQYK